jgi:hypothetical protein
VIDQPRPAVSSCSALQPELQIQRKPASTNRLAIRANFPVLSSPKSIICEVPRRPAMAEAASKMRGLPIELDLENVG